MKERNINEMIRFLPGLILFKILKKKSKNGKDHSFKTSTTLILTLLLFFFKLWETYIKMTDF